MGLTHTGAEESRQRLRKPRQRGANELITLCRAFTRTQASKHNAGDVVVLRHSCCVAPALVGECTPLNGRQKPAAADSLTCLHAWCCEKCALAVNVPGQYKACGPKAGLSCTPSVLQTPSHKRLQAAEQAYA